MYKIRVKKQPKWGEQQDYSLVNSMVHFVGPGAANEEVKDTMGAVDRKDANVEVEGGETVVGDINRDGFLEHMKFVGKRHSQGGVPVNIPEGSFIFSDTKKLRIKDTEVLSKVFGLNAKKGGYTPAEIAKRYDINKYVAILKDEDADAISKRTAAEMLKNNTEKLGMLALVQESMKGFPDGVPAIAESVMAGMEGMQGEQAAPQEEQPEQRYGGMTKYPNGGKVGQTFYVNGQPNKIISRYEGFWDTAGDGSDEWVKFEKPIKLSNGETIDELPLKDFLELEQNRKLDVGMNTGKLLVDPSYYTSVKNLGWGNQPISMPGRGNPFYTLNFSADGKQENVPSDLPKIGDTFTENNVKFKIVGFVTDGSGRNVQVQQISDPNQNIGSYFNTYAGKRVIPVDEFNAKYNRQATPQNNTKKGDGSTWGSDMAQQAPAAPAQNQQKQYKLEGKNFLYAPSKDSQGNQVWKYWNKETNSWGIVGNKASADALNKKYNMNLGYYDPNTKGIVGAPQQKTAQRPAATTQRSTATSTPQRSTSSTPGKFKSVDDAFNSFAMGGSLMRYDDGGEGDPNKPMTTTVANQQQLQQNTNQRIDPNAEIKVGEGVLEDGKKVYFYYKGNQKLVKDEAGNIIKQGPRTDKTSFEQYGSKNISQILAQTPNVRYTTTNFGSFGRQPNVKGTGIYLSSGNAQARSNNDLSPEEWQDFYDRHGDWIDKEYPGGFAKYKKDLQTSKATGDAAAAWFQDKVNEKSMKQFGVPYFQPLNGKEDTPYKRDSKFGQVTYSVPRFFDLEPPAETPPAEGPKPLIAYYCVEAADGTKSVQSVSYKEGEQPVPPTGKSVTEAFADKASAEKVCAINPDLSTVPNKPLKPAGPWWLQDIVNFTGAMTDKVNRYAPTQGKVNMQNVGYDLLDPTRQIANIQEQDARQQQQIENTTDGNVGLAASLASSGDSLAQSANVLGQYENANVGIVNNAYAQNANIENQEAATNEAGRVKYVEDNATLNQNMDNAENMRKWRQIATFNNGTTNWFRKKQMEQVLFPEVYTDPIAGDVYTTPGFSNRDMLGFDTYSPAYSGPGTRTGNISNEASLQIWNDAYNQAKGTMSEEDARKFAFAQLNAQTTANRQAAAVGPTRQQQFNQAVQQGMYLPAPNTGNASQQEAYGGEFTLPWDI